MSWLSGLANKKTVTIQAADKEQGVVLATTKTKKQNKPKVSVNKSVLKKEFSRMSKAVANQVCSISCTLDRICHAWIFLH